MQIKSLQALAAIPSIESEAVQQRLDRVRTFYELLNLPFEVHHLNYTYIYILFLVSMCFTPLVLQSLLGFIAEHEYLFSAKE